MRYEFLLNEQYIAMFSRREAVHVFPGGFDCSVIEK